MDVFCKVMYEATAENCECSRHAFQMHKVYNSGAFPRICLSTYKTDRYAIKLNTEDKLYLKQNTHFISLSEFLSWNIFSFQQITEKDVVRDAHRRKARRLHVSCFSFLSDFTLYFVQSSWNVMGNGDAREGKWEGNWRMEWVKSTLHTTSEHGVTSITTANAHNSAASSRLNWSPCWFKWTQPFRRKTKSGFCACAITFQTQSTYR
jgi:hypothetical protein